MCLENYEFQNARAHGQKCYSSKLYEIDPPPSIENPIITISIRLVVIHSSCNNLFPTIGNQNSD